MSKPQTEIIIKHLKEHGRITTLASIAEYSIFRLSEVVRKLRTSHNHLVPAGHVITTHEKKSAAGKRYGEYRLERSEDVLKRTKLADPRDSYRENAAHA